MLPKDNLTEEFANWWGWEKSFGERLGWDDFMAQAIPVRKIIRYLNHYNVCIADEEESEYYLNSMFFKSCSSPMLS